MQDVSILVAAFAMLALPTRAVLGLRRRGRRDLAPWSRVAFAALASALTVVALLGLDSAADSLLAGHMLQHMLIGDVVPLLLVLAVRGPLCFRVLPVTVVRLSRQLGAGLALALATRPAAAFAFWAASLAVWHVPSVYDRALETEWLHALEHGTFMLAGVLIWAVLLDPARRGTLPGWRRFGYAVALLAASGVLANTLILSYRAVYPSYATPASRPLGLSPVRDQDLAGLVMMLEQLATLGTLAALSARRQLRIQVREDPQRHPLAA
jgi:cytochrome c oxidase assembly factor CtaG